MKALVRIVSLCLLAGCLLVIGLRAQAPQHQTTISWGSVSGVAGYNVKKSVTSGGPYTTLNSSPITATQYTDYNVSAGSKAYYVVSSVANDLVTESANSTEASAITPPFTATILAVSVSGSSATLTWNPSADGSTVAYMVMRGTSSSVSSMAAVATTSAGATTYTDSNLSAGTYYWTVYATAGGAVSLSYPSPVSAKVFPQSPTAITVRAQ